MRIYFVLLNSFIHAIFSQHIWIPYIAVNYGISNLPSVFQFMTILKIYMQLTMELEISGERGNVYFTSKDNSSAEEASAFFDLSWSFRTFLKHFLMLSYENICPLIVGRITR